MSDEKQSKLWRRAFCALALVFIAYVGLVQYERTMLMSQQESPKVGIIQPDNAEIAAFLNSKSGRSALILHERGKLDSYMAFLDSMPGRFAYELHRIGALGSKLDFATSIEGVLAERYFRSLKKEVPENRIQANR